MIWLAAVMTACTEAGAPIGTAANPLGRSTAVLPATVGLVEIGSAGAGAHGSSESLPGSNSGPGAKAKAGAESAGASDARAEVEAIQSDPSCAFGSCEGCAEAAAGPSIRQAAALGGEGDRGGGMP